ncbi:hypothetical protein [Clostridium estertheticum]|uniref:hypothetical protein n=1 Tax=Clostridium estertheticum TaxID=238834 RepID=UPI001CF31A5F|nr:hypothetical protein [Clostridium estertheticum]MCB2354486.1 hypothetical protein [Clostridium estertheticum]WAG42401.1 hypothetical protein LL065_06910 [Clostridium estertheticum]
MGKTYFTEEQQSKLRKNTYVQKVSAKSININKLGNIKGVLTWQYNSVIGTKADTNAFILLIPVNADNTKDNSLIVSRIDQQTQGENGIYTGRADGYGNYEIDDVPVGEYYLLQLSKCTTSDMTISNYAQQILAKLFSAKDWTTLQINLKLNKFMLQSVEIKGNETIIESHDFGNTYF